MHAQISAFRAVNPFNKILKNSTCTFEIHLNKIPITPLQGRSFELLNSLKADFELITHPHPRIRLSVSHEYFDGIGGLYAISRLLSENDLLSAAQQPLLGLNDKIADSFRYTHACVAYRKQFNNQRTRTQSFILKLFNECRTLFGDSIAMAVNIESAFEPNGEPAVGNGMAILSMNSKAVYLLASRDQADWTAELKRTADRTLNIINRRPSQLLSSPGSVLFSAIGNIGRHNWCSPYSPSNVLMYSTPIDPSSANLITWNNGNLMGLTICAKTTHPVFENLHNVINCWETC